MPRSFDATYSFTCGDKQFSRKLFGCTCRDQFNYSLCADLWQHLYGINFELLSTEEYNAVNRAERLKNWREIKLEISIYHDAELSEISKKEIRRLVSFYPDVSVDFSSESDMFSSIRQDVIILRGDITAAFAFFWCQLYSRLLMVVGYGLFNDLLKDSNGKPSMWYSQLDYGKHREAYKRLIEGKEDHGLYNLYFVGYGPIYTYCELRLCELRLECIRSSKVIDTVTKLLEEGNNA